MTDEGLFEVEAIQIPKHLLGQPRGYGGGNLTEQREWTQGEIDWMLEQKANGLNVPQLAKALGRSDISVQIKLKRITKSEDKYNSGKNRKLKYETNRMFFDRVKPKTILDVYAGNCFWSETGAKVTSNDIDSKFDTDFHLDSLVLLCQEYVSGNKYDLIDLDPYGSAYDCFDLALKLSRKAIIVSFGEWGHKRWKRMDFVSPRYGITKVDDYGSGEPFIKEFQRIASCNKKFANPIHTIQYENFLRVYFELSEIKITSQWEEKQ